MIINFSLLTFRQLKRNLAFSLINILGLSLGLAGSFVIGSWVWQEVNYDKHFSDSERIHRVSIGFFNSGAFASGPERLVPYLAENAPEVEVGTRVERPQPSVIYVDDKEFEENPLFVDSAFFQVFDHEFILGDANAALASPNNVVITSELALKYFQTKNAVGKTILYGEGKVPYQIAGVVQASEAHTHLSTSIWMPIKFKNSSNWVSAQYFNYIKLKEGFSLENLEARLENIKKNAIYPIFQADTPYDEWKASGIYDFFVTPLVDIHLNPTMRFDFQEGGNRANVQIFTAAAIFLLVIAIINFVNLSTAQSVKRAKEVGVRKVLGTSRVKLIFQYLMESIAVSIIAMFLGIGLAELFLILFQSFTNEELINDLFLNIDQIVIYLIIGITTGIIAGIYPAFYLSSYKPIDALKSKATSPKSTGFRNYLVVFQFTISVTLIICSMIVFQQLNHLKVVDLGFDRENVLVINNASNLGTEKSAFRDKLMQHSDVIQASFNKRVPAGSSVWLYSFQSKEMEQAEGLQTFIGDHNYLETVGFRLLEGRNFIDSPSDSSAVILTESALKTLLIERESAVGSKLTNDLTIVGVVSDFSFQNFTEAPDPVALLYDPDGYRLSVKLRGNQTADFLEYMTREWQTLSLDAPIEYAFIDDNFESLMEKEKTLGNTMTFFTSIAIFISCLGLFGLAAFVTQQRQKEIGIRKVLGASVTQVLLLLNRTFTRLVTLAVIIATPLSLYLAREWLRNFQYKTDLNILVFIGAGLSAVFISWFTVSYFSLKSATTNPVETLREE
ncbi:MAG: ABC transporter permease [Bacteroidota bacterium]